MNLMKAVVVTPEGIIYQVNLAEPLYQSAGTVVQGGIEFVFPPLLKQPYCFICNENFIFEDMPVNLIASYLYGYNEKSNPNPICGNIVIMKLGFRNGEPHVIGLSSEEARDIERDMQLIRMWFSLEVQHG